MAYSNELHKSERKKDRIQVVASALLPDVQHSPLKEDFQQEYQRSQGAASRKINGSWKTNKEQFDGVV